MPWFERCAPADGRIPKRPQRCMLSSGTCAARDRSGTSSCRVQPRCTEALPGIAPIRWSLTCAPSSPPLSVEHLTYREFLQLAPETTCLLSCLDTKAQYKGMAAIREATEIEEQILDSVARRLPQTKRT
jgi:hypothetical protein